MFRQVVVLKQYSTDTERPKVCQQNIPNTITGLLIQGRMLSRCLHPILSLCELLTLMALCGLLLL